MQSKFFKHEGTKTRKMDGIALEDVIHINKACGGNGSFIGGIDQNSINNALDRERYKAKYGKNPTIVHLVTQLAKDFVASHPFQDGNKRTAAEVFKTILQRNKLFYHGNDELLLNLISSLYLNDTTECIRQLQNKLNNVFQEKLDDINDKLDEVGQFLQESTNDEEDFAGDLAFNVIRNEISSTQQTYLNINQFLFQCNRLLIKLEQTLAQKNKELNRVKASSTLADNLETDDLFDDENEVQEDPEKVKLKSQKIEELERTITGLKHEFIKRTESILPTILSSQAEIGASNIKN